MMYLGRARSTLVGVHTFYVLGDSGTRHAVHFIRRAGMRRFDCSCADFTFRRALRGSHRACKHVAFLREVKRALGLPGVREVER